MTIMEAIKQREVRVSNGQKFLLWDTDEWAVNEWRGRNLICLYRDYSEEEAVKVLLGDE